MIDMKRLYYFKPSRSMIPEVEGMDEAGLKEVIEWWLEHYKGIEHLADNPETWYNINFILERSLNKIKGECYGKI